MRAAPLTHSFPAILSPGETPASGAKSLHAAARAAIVACATSGKLIGAPRGWFTPDRSHPRPIARRTIRTLCEHGLISVRRIGNSRSASLTSTGKWYARTLCSAIASGVQP